MSEKLSDWGLPSSLHTLNPTFASPKSEFDIVAIGTSLGGLEALSELLGTLPKDFPVPILVVQHLHRSYPSYLAEILKGRTSLSVKWAASGETPQPGVIYLATPDHHLLTKKNGTLELSQSEKIQYCRPSVSALFESVALNYGKRAIGVVLTGMGSDGSVGVRIIKRHGGRVLVQAPATCKAASMPQKALDTDCVDFALPLKSLSAALVTLVMVRGAATLFTVKPHAATLHAA